MPCPSYPSWYNRPNNIWWESRLMMPVIVHCPPLPYYVVPLKPKYLLKTLFSSTLSLGTSLNASDNVSHTYKRTGTIIILYVLTFMLSTTNSRQNVLDPNGISHSLSWLCSKFLNERSFYSLRLFPNKWMLPLVTCIFFFWFCTASWPRNINMYLIFSASLLDRSPC